MPIRFTSYLIIIVFLIGFRLNGQTSDLVLTIEQNNFWFDTLKSLDFDQKIDFIKSRILQDTAVYNSNQQRSDRIFLDNLKKEEVLKSYGNIADGRILYFLSYKFEPFKKYKFSNFEWNNWTSTSKIKLFHNFLNSNKIKEVEIKAFDEDAIAIFGSNAGFGVIIFDLNKRKYFKEFERLIYN